jgi:hypothetical protein
MAYKNLLIAFLLTCTATAVPTPSHAIEPANVAAVTASNEHLERDVALNNIHDIDARSSGSAAEEENELLKRYNQGKCNLFVHIDSSHALIRDSEKTAKMELYLYDDKNEEIGHLPQSDIQRGRALNPWNFHSPLPYTILIKGKGDSYNAGDLNFEYAGQSWNGGDTTRCSWKEKNPAGNIANRWHDVWECKFDC